MVKAPSGTAQIRSNFMKFGGETSLCRSLKSADSSDLPLQRLTRGASANGNRASSLLVWRLLMRIHRRARFRIPKSSISQPSLSFQKTIDLREKNSIFHDQHRVYDWRVKTSSL